MSESTRAGIIKNRLTLVMLIVVFVVPIIVAGILIYTDWQPSRKKNHGDLFSPVRGLENFQLKTTNGGSFTLDNFKDKWSILYVGNSSCTESCQQTLYSMRQARLAQGANSDRVQYLYVRKDNNQDESLQKILPEHQQLIVLEPPSAGQNKLLPQLMFEKEHNMQEASGVYLVDPDGQLVMHYNPGFQTKGLIKDLELLLKVR